jgi:hypothetical protein
VDLENLKLVTLSACETGLGEYTGGKGVENLQQAWRARLAEFLQQELLFFADDDLRGRPCHGSISCLTIEEPGKIRDFQIS